MSDVSSRTLEQAVIGAQASATEPDVARRARAMLQGLAKGLANNPELAHDALKLTDRFGQVATEQPTAPACIVLACISMAKASLMHFAKMSESDANALLIAIIQAVP